MPALQRGDKVLVTGANGFIATHVIDQLLLAGLLVRGTVRSLKKGQWVQEYFDDKYGKGKLELVVVEDFGKEGAYDGVLDGVHGIAHLASDLSFSPNPNDIIPPVLKSIDILLTAATATPSIKRFILTSSSTAATNPIPNKRFSITKDSWNDAAVKAAWADPPYEQQRAWDVYGASKTEGERAVWKFVRERQPRFEVNTVLPNANFGRLLGGERQKESSTASWITGLVGKKELAASYAQIPPQYAVNVADTARLHVAALLDPEIVSERIFAFDETWTWNKLIQLCRKIKPDATFPAEVDKSDEDLSTIAQRGRADGILTRHFGHGFSGLEKMLQEQLEAY